MGRREGAWAAFWCVVAVWESLECDLPLLLATAIILAPALRRRDRGGLRAFALLSRPSRSPPCCSTRRRKVAGASPPTASRSCN